MTCEIAVMNIRGVALAADSAVTVGDDEKIYQSAEKLFELSPSLPVGIMTYGAGELMGVPWEVVIADYARRLGERRFDTLGEYADDFIRFVEGARRMFPEPVQRDRFRHQVGSIWKSFYADPLITKGGRHANDADRSARLLALIRNDHPRWENCPPSEGLGDDFADRALVEHHAMLDEMEAEIFGTEERPDEIRQGLRRTVHYFLTRDYFPESEEAIFVIAGFGEADHFPSLRQYRMGPILLDRLKFAKVDEATITHQHTACVVPMAERHAIDTIIEGIHPSLLEKLPGIIAESVHPRPRKRRRRPGEPEPDSPARRVSERLARAIRETQTAPFTAAVAAMPCRELAATAEALVNIAVFRARAWTDQNETVGGAIDVALISKAAGFQWVQRKRLPILARDR